MVVKVKSVHTHRRREGEVGRERETPHRPALSTSQLYLLLTDNQLRRSNELFLKIYFLVNFTYVCVCVWVYAHACRPPGATVTGSSKSLHMCPGDNI